MSVRDIVQAAAGVSTGNPNAWDVTKASVGAPTATTQLNIPYNHADIGLNNSIAASSERPNGIYVKPDGLKCWIVGPITDTVYQYSMSRSWDARTLSYDSISFSVNAQDTVPIDLFFKPDGTKMFILGQNGDDVNEYALSTAWDITTASFTTNTSIVSQDTAPYGFWFRGDGLKMYMAGDTNTSIYEYDLSTAWDISTLSYVQSFSVSTQGRPVSVFLTEDGLTMWVGSLSNYVIWQYDLSTAWDISTAVYAGNANRFIAPSSSYLFQSCFVKPDATIFFYGIDISGAYNIRQGIVGRILTAQDTNPFGLFFKPDGTKMYVLGYTGQDVNEYDLSTAWDPTTASYVQNFSIAAQDTAPLDIFFKTDGTKMYLVGQINDSIYEYNLSTAWDISTASYVQSFSVASQDTNPVGVFFKDDGSKMYMLGGTGDDVNEYNLSTPWDISTASYVQNFSVNAQDTNPTAFTFKPDGTKMYVIGSTGDDVNEYDLSTAWDISTASYLQVSSPLFENVPRAIFWNPNGEQFFSLGPTSDAIFTYNISPT